MQLDLLRYWQESTAYKCDVYLLATSGSKCDVALFNSRATCASWLRKTSVFGSVRERGNAKTPTMLCGVYTQQLSCRQNSIDDSILMNMKLSSACTLDGYFEFYCPIVSFTTQSSYKLVQGILFTWSHRGARSGVKPPRTKSSSLQRSTMRKWETPLSCGSPSTGFLPLIELVDALWVCSSSRNPYLRTQARPAIEYVSGEEGLRPKSFFTVFSFVEYILLHALKYSMAPGSSCEAEGMCRSSADETQLLPRVVRSLSESVPCKLSFSLKRCL